MGKGYKFAGIEKGSLEHYRRCGIGKGMAQKYIDRRTRIHRMRQDGEYIRVIAEKEGLSVERIRQILKQAPVSDRMTVHEDRT